MWYCIDWVRSQTYRLNRFRKIFEQPTHTFVWDINRQCTKFFRPLCVRVLERHGNNGYRENVFKPEIHFNTIHFIFDDLIAFSVVCISFASVSFVLQSPYSQTQWKTYTNTYNHTHVQFICGTINTKPVKYNIKCVFFLGSENVSTNRIWKWEQLNDAVQGIH